MLILSHSRSSIRSSSKGVVILNNTTASFASNNNYTCKPPVLYSKLDGKGVVILRGATVIDGTGSVPKPDAVIIVNANKIVDVLTDDSKYHTQCKRSKPYWQVYHTWTF